MLSVRKVFHTIKLSKMLRQTQKLKEVLAKTSEFFCSCCSRHLLFGINQNGNETCLSETHVDIFVLYVLILFMQSSVKVLPKGVLVNYIKKVNKHT